LIVLALAAGLIAAVPGYAAIAAPTPTMPANTSSSNQSPVFGWNAVTGASYYTFQLASDAGFNSINYSFNTKNTRATITNALADNTYWWRVRAVNASSIASPWSNPMQFTKSWGDVPVLESPADGDTVSFPEPLVLNWDPTPYAQRYHVILAHDSGLTSIVSDLDDTSATGGTEWAPQQLAPGTYYWEVWPIDAAGHEGQGSGVSSFTWDSPSAASNLQVTDLSSDPQVFDPLFSWDAVGGAKGYELEINPAADFSSGSKICCSGTIYSTSYAPTTVLENNTFYWRVRPIDVSGTAGDWTEGSQFTAQYDVDVPAVTNLRMITTDGSDLAGTDTTAPIVAWDPVPGASYYEVNVTVFTGGICDWGSTGQWNSKTASTYWTPLGNGLSASKPYSGGPSVATDSTGLTINGDYCVRVRADRDRAAGNVSVFGAYTYLNGGATQSFTFTGFALGGSCSPSCNAGYLGDDDSLLPLEGVTTPRLPLFTWAPLSGKGGYFVIVAKDASFTNIVDYAWTKIPAYAPRTGSAARTYTDESTSYYWAVLPATSASGTGAVGNPLLASAHDFIKASVPPVQEAPADGALGVDGPVQFQWDLTEGARKFHIVVDDSNTFSSPIIDTTTDATSYISYAGLPQGTLYWKVQAQDENTTGLNWSPIHSFTHTLAAPTVVPTGPGINPASGPDIPSWRWNPVDGAVKYELEAKWERTPGTITSQTFQTTSTAWTATSMTGVGLFQWRVHALYPTATSTTVKGVDTGWQSFVRTIPAPTGLASDIASTVTGTTRVLTTWNPRLGAKQYKVEFSTTNSFATPFETATIQNAAFAPTMYSAVQYGNGGTIYWRVAAVDADGNTGSWATSTLTLPAKMLLSSSTNGAHKGVYNSITITVKNAYGVAVAGAAVKATGAGITAVTKSTGLGGKVTFKLKPTKAGKLTFAATKSAYIKATITVAVY
jgi:hypothetical protein